MQGYYFSKKEQIIFRKLKPEIVPPSLIVILCSKISNGGNYALNKPIVHQKQSEH